jgi:hypothetical protein
MYSIVEKNIFTGPYIFTFFYVYTEGNCGYTTNLLLWWYLLPGFYTQHTGSRSCPGVGGRGPNFFTYLKNIKMNQAFYILHLFYSNSKLLQSTIDAKVKKTLRVWK